MKVRFSSPRSLEPDAELGMKLPYAPSKRVASKLSWYLLLAVVCSPLIYIAFTAISSVLLIVEPGHVALGKIEINSNSMGRIDTLNIAVGDHVEKGDTIAKLHDSRLAADILRLRTELELLQQGMNEHARDRAVNAAKAKLALAIENQQFYNDQYSAMQTLFKRRSATTADVNTARIKAHNARLALVEQQTELIELSQAPSKSVMQARLEAELQSLMQRDEELTQRAAASGRVLDVFVRESEVVSVGDNLALMGEQEQAYVLAYLNPENTRYARIGQQAVVKFPSGQSMAATISSLPEVTHRLPSEFARPLGQRSMKIPVHLKLNEALPHEARVEGLPVSVRLPFTVGSVSH